MTRIVMVHPFDPLGDKVGGIETLVRSLLRHAPAEVQADVLGVTQDPYARPVGRWSEIRVGGRDVRLYPVFVVKEPNRRTRIPLFLRFSIVSLFSAPPLDDAILVFHRWEPALIKRQGCAGRVLCVHAKPSEWIGSGSEVRWRYAPWIFRRLEESLLPTLDRVRIVHKGGEREYAERYPDYAGLVEFLPTWFEPDVFTLPSERDKECARGKLLRKYEWPDTSRVVLFAGRMEAQKDPILAIKVIAEASKRFSDIRAVFVGTGSLKKNCEDIAQELGVDKRIAFCPPFTPPDLADCMHASDVFLMTSQFEGMPTIVLEAQACGLPIVSCPVGEVPQIVQSGISGEITLREVESLADSLIKILSRNESLLGIKCAQAVEDFSADKVVEDFYDDIISACR